jgi:hypothetical protein
MPVVLIVAGTVILVFILAANPALMGAVLPMVIVGGAILAPVFLRHRRAAEERGRIPLFETTGWGTYSTTHTRLSVYDDFLVVAQYAPVVIPFSEVISAEATNILRGHWLVLMTRRATYRLHLYKNANEVVRLLPHGI